VTAGQAGAAGVPAAGVPLPRVRAVRAFIGRRRRGEWLDWYVTGFACVIALVYLADFLTGPLTRLAAAGHPVPGHAAAVQAAAGLLAAVAGGLLGVLLLAAAGPYLRPGQVALPVSWLLLAAAAGASCCLAAVAAAALVQPRPRARSGVRAVLAAVAVLALACGAAAGRWPALLDTVTGGFGGLATPALAAVAAASVVLAAVAGIAAWASLGSFPASVLRDSSARAGRTLLAASFLNLPLLAWIAEDDHWRGRVIRSRRWPGLPPALALAWADWRRLGRRPGLLAVTAATALLPALIGGAVTGRGQRAVVAAALLAGAAGAGVQGTAALRRDLNDPALRRLLGVSAARALAARAVLPALLSAAWLAAAFALLAAAGILPGWLWAGAGVLAGPGAAAAALRMAGTAPVNPAERTIDTGGVSAPPWLITRALSLALGAAGLYPVLSAVLAGRVHPAKLAAQAVFSAVVLGGYLLVAGRRALPA
jgi:hypothetical protein